MDLSAVTKLPPKRLAIVAIVGVGGGLLWRRYNAKKGVAASTTSVAPNDVAPIYSQGAANDLIGSATAARDVGQGTINLPITKSIITVGGVDYYIDQNGNTTPVHPVSVGGGTSTTPLPANVDQTTGVWDKTGVPPGISLEPTVAYGGGGIGYDAHGNPTTLNNGAAPWL